MQACVEQHAAESGSPGRLPQLYSTQREHYTGSKLKLNTGLRSGPPPPVSSTVRGITL